MPSNLTPSRHVLTGRETILRFLLAGRATFTLRNAKTKRHLSYRLRLQEESSRWVLEFLGQGRPERIGVINARRGLSYLRGADIPEADPRFQGFDFFWFLLARGETFPPALECWHEGCCGRCGRQLTDPASIVRGFGPDCWEVIVACSSLQTRLRGLLLALAAGPVPGLPAPLAELPEAALSALLRLLASSNLPDLVQAYHLAEAADLAEEAMGLVRGLVAGLLPLHIGSSDARQKLAEKVKDCEVHPFFLGDDFARAGRQAEAEEAALA